MQVQTSNVNEFIHSQFASTKERYRCEVGIEMKIILLSGGSGKRLWPLSNELRSKQFLRLLKNEEGNFQSMVQRVYSQIRKAGIEAEIVVATGAAQADAIISHLGNEVEILKEPERRDTFPAIALASAYLALEKNTDPEEVILVLPVDPYADMEYFNVLVRMEEAVQKQMADLVLMGIKPSHPSSKFGYIVPAKETDEKKDNQDDTEGMKIYRVERFTEKPSEETAQALLAEGAVWNGGVFAFRLGYLMDIVRRYAEEAGVGLNYRELYNNYRMFKKTSFDYEVAERAESVAMLEYRGYWKDLGTWNMLTEEMSEKVIGRVTMGEDTCNTAVINELSIPIIALGVKDLVVAASPDGILITDKEKSAYLKPYADQLNERPMTGEGSWGNFTAYDYIRYEDDIRSLTKHLTVKAGRTIGYQIHRIRDEILTFVDGIGDMVVDGRKFKVGRGDVVYIAKGQMHAIKAGDMSDLHYIEVQIGSELSEEDTEGFEWQWQPDSGL